MAHDDYEHKFITEKVHYWKDKKLTDEEGHPLTLDFGLPKFSGGGGLSKKDILASEIRLMILDAFTRCSTDAEKAAFIDKALSGTGFTASPSEFVAAPASSLPAQAPALWLEREDRTESVPDFIRRVYAPWLGQGLTQAHVSHLDRSLYNALQKWLGKAGNSLEAAGVDLPSKKQMNDRQLAETFGGAVSGSVVTQALREASPESRERMRLYHVAKRREARHKFG